MSATDDTMVLTRHFDASPRDVFRAFVDPAQLTLWFGPLAYHVPLVTIDVDARTGGFWRMTMVNNDDPTMLSPIDSVLTEVEDGSLLAGYEIATGFPGVPDGTKLLLRLEFGAEEGGSRLTITQGPFPWDMQELSSVGWGLSLHKLTALLETPERFRSALVES